MKKINKNIRRAFTLIEILFAVVILGLAIASLVGANISFTRANGAGTDMTTAEFLIEQIRELTVQLPPIDPQGGSATFGNEESNLSNYDDVDDFDNKTYSPPINAARATLSQLPNFSQQITVQNVSTSNFQLAVTDHSSDFIRVTVQIFQNNTEVASANWIRANY
jgi:prepilin-type N-terminal cleavage/methylation domain-containing protein